MHRCPAIAEFLALRSLLDEATFEYWANLHLPTVKPISLQDLKRRPRSSGRGQPEHGGILLHLLALLTLHVLRLDPTVDSVTYLDADLYFFSSPEPLFDELGAGSILMMNTGFPPQIQIMGSTGLSMSGI